MTNIGTGVSIMKYSFIRGSGRQNGLIKFGTKKSVAGEALKLTQF